MEKLMETYIQENTEDRMFHTYLWLEFNLI